MTSNDDLRGAPAGDGAAESSSAGDSDAVLSQILDVAAAPAAGEALQARMLSDFDRVVSAAETAGGAPRPLQKVFGRIVDGASLVGRFAKGGALALFGVVGFMTGAASAGGGAEEDMAVAYFESALAAGVDDGLEGLWDAE